MYSLYKTEKQRVECYRNELVMIRDTWLPHWRDISDNILPTRAIMNPSDANKGDKRNTKIHDSTPTHACATLEAGLMTNATSPATKWFRMISMPETVEFDDAKHWLDLAEEEIRGVFSRSNTYECLSTVYADLAAFGTAAGTILDDEDTLIHIHNHPPGTYALGVDHKNRVNTFCRDYRYTVAQVMKMFWDPKKSNDDNWRNFSETVKQAYATHNPQTPIDICHLIYPNETYEADRPAFAQNKRFRSYYWERGTANNNAQNPNLAEDVFLRRSGFDLFPVLAPRWKIRGNDPYAIDCPGMTALPDCKQLHLGEKRGLQGLEKMVMPPMKGPPELKDKKSSILPNETTYLAEIPGKEFKPIHETNIRLDLLEQKQAQVRERINRAFYVDLFLMHARNTRREQTAEETKEKSQERLVQLGPMFQRLNLDLLNPLIDNVFYKLLAAGALPKPPKSLQGKPLKVEYLSLMAQAQKLVGLSTIERLTLFVTNLAATTQNPSVMDKLDPDQTVDVYADGLGVTPKIIRSDEAVQKIREQRARAEAEAQQLAQAQQAAMAAKDLSKAQLETPSMLSQLSEQ